MVMCLKFGNCDVKNQRKLYEKSKFQQKYRQIPKYSVPFVLNFTDFDNPQFMGISLMAFRFTEKVNYWDLLPYIGRQNMQLSIQEAWMYLIIGEFWPEVMKCILSFRRF